MPDLSEFEQIGEVEQLRRALDSAHQKLAKAHARTEQMVFAAREGAREAMLAHGPIPPVKPPAADRRKRGKPEVALWHLTDWQGSKVTSTYNSQVMRERVMRFCQRAARLTDIQRADHPVRECTIMFGGDLIEGLFNFPAQVFAIDATLFKQYVTASRLLVDVVRHALCTYEKVTVVEEWGNHGRIGSKRAAVPPSDNVDRMIYWAAHAILASENRLTWNFDEDRTEDIQHVQVGNYRALLVHGDEQGRNGFVSRNQFVQGCNRWRSGAHHWPFQDVYVGHYHGHQEDSLANGEGAVYWTGSPESDNRYANDRMAAAASPSQRLHFIDPQEGMVTAQYKVWLDR